MISSWSSWNEDPEAPTDDASEECEATLLDPEVGVEIEAADGASSLEKK